MLNKEICKHCHNDYIPRKCRESHSSLCNPEDHNWCEDDEQNWNHKDFPHVICWESYADIRKKPPDHCPFYLEHFIANQREFRELAREFCEQCPNDACWFQPRTIHLTKYGKIKDLEGNIPEHCPYYLEMRLKKDG